MLKIVQFSKYIRMDLFFLYLVSFWLIFLFLFNPHYIELTGTLESWFPYKGLIAYKDFAAYHFPLGRLILLPFYILAGWNLEVSPFLGLFFGLGSLVIIYLFGKKFLSQKGSSLSMLFFGILFWYLATGILFFHEILIGFLLALIILLLFSSIKKVGPVKLFTLGFLISLTELSGQIASITLLTLILIILLVIAKTKNSKMLIYFSIGLIIPWILTLFYYWKNHALEEFLYYNINYYLDYRRYEKDSLDKLPFRDLAIFFTPLIFLAYLVIINFIKKRKLSIQILLIFSLSLSTIPFIVFSIYHPHHLNYALPILALSLGFSYDYFSKLQNFAGRAIIIVVVFVLIASSSVIVPWHFERIIFPRNLRIQNDVYFDSKDPMKSAISWVKENTQKDSTLLVIGDALFYFKADKLPINRPSKGIPYAWSPFEKVKEELYPLADFWVVDRQFLKNLILTYKRPDMVDFVNQTLKECFKNSSTFDNWEIWERLC